MKRTLWIPLLILLGAAGVIAVIYGTRPQAAPNRPEPRVPSVRVQTMEPAEVVLTVRAQGTVAPRNESEIVSQVSGEVLSVSSSLLPGGFFEEGDELLRVDRVEYEAALESARAAQARTRSESNRARKDRDRQRKLADRSVASQSRIDEAENAYRVAEALAREADTRVGIAERDLARTLIRAPYAGRVRSEGVDLGQFVTRGQSLARIYAVDYAEVRLPVPDRDLRFMNVPLGYRNDSSRNAVGAESVAESGPRVALRAEFAGEEHEWPARVVRTEGELDPKSRMVTLVARVEDPYGRALGGDRPPLAVGLFVDAFIEGHRIEEAYVLPRAALHSGDRVLVLDSEGRARFREVSVLREERDRVVIDDGLAPGEVIVVSPTPGAVDGMRLRVAKDRARADGEES